MSMFATAPTALDSLRIALLHKKLLKQSRFMKLVNTETYSLFWWSSLKRLKIALL
jgi:hypothetical protein